MTMPNIDFERVLEAAIQACSMHARGIHGANHWLRVERIGLLIGERAGADLA
jgi:hypothetical protein